MDSCGGSRMRGSWAEEVRGTLGTAHKTVTGKENDPHNSKHGSPSCMFKHAWWHTHVLTTHICTCRNTYRQNLPCKRTEHLQHKYYTRKSDGMRKTIIVRSQHKSHTCFDSFLRRSLNAAHPQYQIRNKTIQRELWVFNKTKLHETKREKKKK